MHKAQNIFEPHTYPQNINLKNIFQALWQPQIAQ